ncbi:uncharacterized protein BT62DRAFT_620642 [Guyanagaster necrorhizus]|uniref:DUF6534 domain-containing protein n=1 Tax=Guyanagaster necrorhizus TaxID=856835 RepID=A0A9P8AVZ1_9AGAR|nr:uncharacterized protein BT62DRAFT_620642 [Guyanagaster necrorhizus MCA 3950]KAG7450033.1 hypothetical protein BT62DRAFT_620642 [Guyanagaster necrorhizus MCA 3950]
MTSPIAITHGPALVGIFLACILYGIMLLQCFSFWTHFSKDRVWLKCYVGLLLFTDTLSTIFAMWWIYNLLVNNFENLTAFANADWLLAADPPLVGITGTFCQLFFAWRIKVLTGKLWLTAIVVTLSIISGLSAIGSGIAVSWVVKLADFTKFESIGCLWLATTAAVDILITVIMSLNLNQRRTGFRATDKMLNKIVRATVANGLLTTVFAIVELSLYVGKPNTGLHIGFSFVLPKLYCNSVLSSLNARKSTSPSSTDNTSSHISGQRPLPATGGHSTRNDALVITVNTEHHEMYDLNNYNGKGNSEWDDSAEAGSHRTKQIEV